jgi:hypothetical protein
MEEKILGVTSSNDTIYGITEKTIVKFFSSYNKGFEAFFYFCKGKFIYRAPNVSIRRFNYCPIYGSKIYWNGIYERNKKKFQDYDLELDKTFYNNN